MDNLVTIILSAITAVGILLTGIGTMRSNRRILEVHDAVKTSNGETIGELVEAGEVRRVAATDSEEP